MTGRQWTITSPSRTSSSRNTPWVDGCWGPMLTVSSSRSAPSTRSFVDGGALSVVAIQPPRDREVDGLCAERLGAPQRVAAPLVGQQDPPEIGMVLELDTEQVEQLALVPVCAGHDARDAGGFTISARLQPQPGALLERIEQIDQLEPICPAQQVHRG